MPRRPMYPEGAAQMNIIVPVPVKDAFLQIAGEQRESISRVITLILEDHLRRRGYLRDRDREPEGARA